MNPHPKDRPVSVELVPARHGSPGAVRLVVTLLARGCAYAERTRGGCAFCGFWDLSARGEPVGTDDLVAQIESALDLGMGSEAPVVAVDIYNSGSFLNPAEVPWEAQQEIVGRAGLLATAERIMVESRPEHVVEARARLQALQRLVPHVDLEVGIGLETADDGLRQEVMHKGFSLALFEAAARVLEETGCRLRAYVFLGPPGLDEREALDDVRRTAAYLKRLSERESLPLQVALQPAFVARGSACERLWASGAYRPPGLWTVLEAVRACHDLLEVTVGLGDEGLAGDRVPSNCGRCDRAVRETLARYNATGDISVLDGLDCDCRTGG